MCKPTAFLSFLRKFSGKFRANASYSFYFPRLTLCLVKGRLAYYCVSLSNFLIYFLFYLVYKTCPVIRFFGLGLGLGLGLGFGFNNWGWGSC